MNRYKTLAKIAAELDALGFYSLAADIDNQLSKEVADKQQQYYTDYQARRNEHKTQDIQRSLNYYLSEMGSAPIALTGKNDAATQAALESLGIHPGDYNSWGELYDLVHQKGTQAVQDTQSRDLSRPFGAQSLLAPGAQAREPIA